MDILSWFTFAGVGVFAVSGALVGLRKQMDFVGVAFMAVVTGVGGGTMRDLLTGTAPVGWVRDPADIALCVFCALMVSLLNPWLVGQRMRWLLYADAAGLSLFCVLGASVTQAAGVHPFVCILFGAMTATFGGIIRDVVANETPVLFRKEIYVTAALVGATIFILLPGEWSFAARSGPALACALIVRVLALRRSWTLPFPRYESTKHD